MSYIDAATREKIRDGARQSAQVLADRFVDWFDPATVVDIGCGEGFLVQSMRDQGRRAFGVDGDPGPGVDLVADLTDPRSYPDMRGKIADLAVCLEVGEHLPHSAADVLVEWLAANARVVAFSAALPRQGGPNHINEQPPDWWAERFAAHGMVGTGAYRWQVWGDQRIEPWYRQNLLVFARPDVASAMHLRPPDGCPYVVHPEIWELYRK